MEERGRKVITEELQNGGEGRNDTINKLKIHIHIEVRNLTARFHNPQRLCSRTLSCSVIKVSLSPIHMVKSQSSWRELLKPSASLETPWRAHQKYDTSSEAGRFRKNLLHYLWHHKGPKNSYSTRFYDRQILQTKPHRENLQKHTGVCERKWKNSFGDCWKTLLLDACLSSAHSDWSVLTCSSAVTPSEDSGGQKSPFLPGGNLI